MPTMAPRSVSVITLLAISAVTGDLAKAGADRYAHITLAGNRVR